MQTHRIDIDQLARLPARALFTPSRDHNRVGYFSNQSGRFELYVLDLNSATVAPITNGQAPKALRAGFVWGFDDRRIFYAKDENGNEQNNLFEADLDCQVITQLNNDPHTQEYVLDVFPEDQALLVASNRGGQMNLYRFDRASRQWTALTNLPNPVMSGQLSPDASRIAVNANESPNLFNLDGYVMNADGSELSRVWRVEEGSHDVIVDWHPDGQSVLVSSDASGTQRVGVLPLTGGPVTWLSPEGVEAQEAEFSPDGRWVVVLESQESDIRPVLYASADGARRVLELPPGVASTASFVLNGDSLLLYYSSDVSRGELLLYDLISDHTRTLLPCEYGSIDPAVFVGNRHVYYPSSDGQPVPAILYVPRDIPKGATLPAVIDVHGGPTGQYFRSFNALAQLLVDQGYVVLQPNFRGSTGYGRSWREANYKDWGGQDLEDVAAGVHYLAELGYVDPNRVAIFGGSFGGYMSYIAAVKKPELFKVVIPWVGITDLALLYEEDMSHFKYYLRSLMGDPEEDAALWRDRSAIHFVDRVKAHLSIVHGVNDPRCPIAQARRFRDRLVELGRIEGRDFDYIELDEGHGSGGDPTGTARMYHLIVDFLEQHL